VFRHSLSLFCLFCAVLLFGNCGDNQQTTQDAGQRDTHTSDSFVRDTLVRQDSVTKDDPSVGDTQSTPEQKDAGSVKEDTHDDVPEPTQDASVTPEPEGVSIEKATEPIPEPTPEPLKEATPPDTAPPAPVPVFVAQGDIGRTMISCDDGKTWKANRSWELEGDAAVCGKKAKVECYALSCQFMQAGQCKTKDPCDCDHHPGAPMGMTYGNGWFVGTWGWGPPGSVRRSQDGVKWDTVIKDSSYGGIDFGAGRIITGGRTPKISDDGGKTWTDGAKADLKDPTGTVWNVRSFAFVKVGGANGRFVITGESGTKRDILISADKGKTWTRPTNLERTCASGVLGIAGGGGVIVVVSRNKSVCYSTDAGKTFKKVTVPDAPASKPIWDGKAFHFWLTNKRYSSPKGKTWTMTPLKLVGGTGRVQLGAISRSDKTGTYVAVRGGWNNWYSKQSFYRSTDGVNWQELAKSDYVASHRIRHIRFGFVKRSAKGCP